jgi:hypothetical protein
MFAHCQLNHIIGQVSILFRHFSLSESNNLNDISGSDFQMSRKVPTAESLVGY